MKLDYDGRTWQLDPDELELQQAMAIQLFTGMTIGRWLGALAQGLDDENFLKSSQALFWLMLMQNGEPRQPITEVNCKIIKFCAAFGEAMEREGLKAPDPQEQPDPTSPPPGSEPSPEPASTPTPQTLPTLSLPEPGG